MLIRAAWLRGIIIVKKELTDCAVNNMKDTREMIVVEMDAANKIENGLENGRGQTKPNPTQPNSTYQSTHLSSVSGLS